MKRLIVPRELVVIREVRSSQGRKYQTEIYQLESVKERGNEVLVLTLRRSNSWEEDVSSGC